MPARVYGERLQETEGPGRLLDEHLARYRFAAMHLRARRVLDVATGSGRGADLLRVAGRKVIGVEIDEAAAQAAARRGLACVRADASRLPFPAASFDGCVSSETIEHLEDPERFIAELARVIDRNGTLVLTTPNRASDAIPHDNPYHLRELTADELIKLLSPAFVIVAWAGQYPRSALPRQALRRILARAPFLGPIRALVPPRYRAPFGRAAAGSPNLVALADPVSAAPATFGLVARRA